MDVVAEKGKILNAAFNQFIAKRSEGVSLVIPCAKHIDLLAQNVEYLKKCTENYEIVFSVNSPDAPFRNWVKSLCDENENFNCIIEDKMVGFAPAVNAGIESAKNDLIIILNDDVIVHDGWVERLYNCLSHAQTLLKCRPIAMVGPMSNFVGGDQVMNIGGDLRPDQVNGYAQKHGKANKFAYVSTGFISGFCMMTRKSILDEIGLLDERFHPGGWEDNDLSLRAQEAGYDLAISADCFIYHFGSRTISDTWKIPHKTFIEKWCESSEKKLVAMFRVKIEDDLNFDLFDNALADCRRFADEVVVLDDGSPKDILGLIKKHMIEKYQRFDREFNESRDRNELMQMAKSMNPDWIISLDHDEVMEEAFTREVAQRLMNPVNPHVKSYMFHWSTFWRGEEMCRVDGLWGNVAGNRMFKNEKDQFVGAGTESTFHCGNIHIYPEFNIRRTSYRIKHYGYADYEEQAKKKYEFYTEIDKNPDPVMVGAKDYKHLIDESNLKLHKFEEWSQCSLILMSNDINITDFLIAVDQVYSHFNEIIFIDTSPDGQEDVCWFAEKLGAKVLKFNMHTNPEYFFTEGEWKGRFKDFSAARNFGKEHATQRWLFYLDFDESLDNPHLIRKMMDESMHAYLFPCYNTMPGGSQTLSETTRMFLNIPEFTWSHPVHELIEDSLDNVKNVKVGNSPIKINHRGFLDKDHDEKMRYYLELNEMELKNNPESCKPWYNTGLHYVEQGPNSEDYLKGVKCMMRATELNPGFYLPKVELGLHHTHNALVRFAEANKILPVGHPMKEQTEDICKALAKISAMKAYKNNGSK